MDFFEGETLDSGEAEGDSSGEAVGVSVGAGEGAGVGDAFFRLGFGVFFSLGEGVGEALCFRFGFGDSAVEAVELGVGVGLLFLVDRL